MKLKVKFTDVGMFHRNWQAEYVGEPFLHGYGGRVAAAIEEFHGWVLTQCASPHVMVAGDAVRVEFDGKNGRIYCLWNYAGAFEVVGEVES